MSISGFMFLGLGAYYFIKGEIRTGQRVLRGLPARLLGLVVIGGLFLPYVVGLGWATIRLSQGMDPNVIRAEMQPYARLLNFGLPIGCAVMVVFFAYVFGEPAQTEPAPDVLGKNEHAPPSDNPYQPPSSGL